jgi:integrase
MVSYKITTIGKGDSPLDPAPDSSLEESGAFFMEVGFVEFVQPLRSLASINRMKQVLREHSLRDYTLFVLGIHTGLRISDLLSLKVKDIADWDGKRIVIHDRLALREKKTGKAKIILVNKNAKSALRSYLNAMDLKDTDPVFLSKKRDPDNRARSIGRWQAHHILNRAAREAGISDRIGTHTLRKTFGYHHYRKGFDITKLQQIFNHSSPAVTLAYIGFTQDEIDEAYVNSPY